MAAIPVRLKHTSYEVRIGVGVRHDITSLTAPYDKAVIITDENVNRLYGELFDFPKIVTASGEQAKTWENAKWILAEMAALGLTRRSVVLALGGGVVGDVAGFCAAIYMRGPLHPNSHYPPRTGRQCCRRQDLWTCRERTCGCFPQPNGGS